MWPVDMMSPIESTLDGKGRVGAQHLHEDGRTCSTFGDDQHVFAVVAVTDLLPQQGISNIGNPRRAGQSVSREGV